MSHVVLPHRWRRQPSGAIELDRAHPLNRGVLVAFNGTRGQKSLVRDEFCPLSGAGAVVGYEAGRGVYTDGTSNAGLDLVSACNLILPNGAAQVTIAVLRQCVDTTGRTATLFESDTGASDRLLAHVPYNDGNCYWDFGNATAGSGRVSTTFTKTTRVESLIFVAGQTLGREIWRDGLRIASDASAKATLTDQANPLRIGGSSDQSDNQVVYLFAVYDAEWNESMCRAFAENPWQIYSPVRRRIYVDAGAAAFNAALMAAMSPQWPITVITQPRVVASGMTPPDNIPK
jgi:hypothetical protein